MLKNYRVTVNGTSYDVVVEELDDAAAGAVRTMPAAPAPTPTPAAPAAAPAPAPAAPKAGAGTPVKAPMPGNILDVKVKTGDKVAANDVVVILEAMKMENEIVTPVGGTVTSVVVSKGQTVNSDDILITVE